MKCDWFDIGCKLDLWFAQKWDVITTFFWQSLDTVAIIGVACCMFLGIFGLEQPKKWVWWIIGIYVLAKIFQYANKVGAI